MSGKLHSKQIEDYMNQLSCSLECVINSLATFQAMMDKIFKKEIKENLIIVYMDDILAFFKTINGLREIKQIILEKAQEYDLYFKAKKCKFRKPKIEYLGLVVEEGKLAMDPAKLKGILDWPAPKTVKEVRSFLGFGDFYCCFVKEFSHLVHPLNDLLKKDKKFVWSEECQEYFDQLKKRFTEEPVLMMPNHSKPFQIQVDSSLMSTPDALPTEIALITLPSFEFQVYLTSLHHYYHRPITLSTFRLLYQPTIDHMALINALRLPLKKFFCTQDWHLTHTQYSLTQPQLTEFKHNIFPRLLSVSLSLFSFQSHASRVMGPTYSSIAAIINFQVQLWSSLRSNRGDLYFRLHL
jgi:hypothetical protein